MPAPHHVKLADTPLQAARLCRLADPLVVLSITGALLLPLLFFAYQPDDSYITFRYVHNWLAHGEIAWNLGERIEGYSHPLFLALVAFGGVLGLDLRVTAKVLGLACGVAAVIHSASFSGRRFGPRARGYSAVILATSTCFLVWEVGCLETTLFAWLCIAACDAALSTGQRRNLLLAVALLALSLTRPEGPLIAVATLAWSALARRGKPWGESYGWVPVFAAGLVVFAVWRHVYYHDWLPNPFYVKTGGGTARLMNGLSYAGKFVVVQSPLLLLAGAMGRASRERDDAREATLLVSLILAFYSSFVVWAGGDWMPGFRFFANVLPLWAVLGGFLIGQRAVAGPRRRLAPSAWALVVVSALLARASLELYVDPTLRDAVLVGIRRPDSAERQMARYLNAHAKEGALVATTEAGLLPYETPQLRYIDLIGLNDRHLAYRSTSLLNEDAGDPDYVFGRNPEFLVSWGYRSNGGALAPAVRSVGILMNDPRFREYQKTTEYSYGASSGLFLYRRRTSE